MLFAISLTVFAFSTMDIRDCLLKTVNANTCLVEHQAVYSRFLASSLCTFLLLALLVAHECLRLYFLGILLIQLSTVTISIPS